MQVEPVPWARGAGVVDLARSIRSGADEQASGRLALHVLDVLEAIQRAAAEGCIVEISSPGAVNPDVLPESWNPAEAIL